MLATVPSATLVGVDGIPVTVEVHVARGLPVLHRRRPPRHVVPRGPRPGPGRPAHERLHVARHSASRSTWRPRRCARSAPALDLAIAVGRAGGQRAAAGRGRGGAGLRRRARPRRHAAPRAGRAVRSSTPSTPPRSWCHRPRCSRPSWSVATGCCAPPTSRRLVEALNGRGPVAGRARPARRAAGERRPRPGRRAGPARSPAPRSRSPPPAATTC